MKVTISVGGKFHAFHLARQLEKKGYLDTIFTSYPWFAVKDSKLARSKVKCLFSKEVLDRGLHKIPYLDKKIDISYLMCNFFDRKVSRRIKPCDIFVGAPGYSLHTIRKLRRSSSAKIILESVSSHIQAAMDILNEEEGRLGLRISTPSSHIVEKVLQEYQEADYIVVPSIFAKESFLAKGFPPEKIISVPWGVDIERFRVEPKNDKAFRIIVVGLRIIKGIQYILEAIDQLKIKNLELCLIGGGIDVGLSLFLKKYSGNFKYMGAIPQRELYKHYSQGSISILFSLEDGFGMALLEAMACELPVICSESVGAKDVVRNNIDGFIVPARDTKALKEKILYFYQNPHICQEMGRQARENVSKNFTWDNYGEKIINHYSNLLK